MKAADAIVRLRRLGAPVITTAEAAKLFETSIDVGAKTMARLAQAGVLSRVRRGLWAIAHPLDPHLVAEFLTAPNPSYVSLQTALYHHGMISQVPSVVYAVSLAKRQTIRTTVGVFSLHRVAPEFFGGFDVTASGAKLASPEKALLDVFYLTSTSTRLFSRLPELELPRGFRVLAARHWIERVSSPRLRTIMTRRLERALASR